MNRKIAMAALLAIGTIAGCKQQSQNPGHGQSGAQQAKTANDQSEQAYKKAQDAQDQAKQAEEHAKNAQNDLTQDQKKLQEDTQKLNQQRQQAVSAQQNAQQQGQQAAQVSQQANQQALQDEQNQVQQQQAKQQQFAQQQQQAIQQPGAGQSGAAQSVSGTVGQVSNDGIVLQRQGQAPLQLNTDASTQITLDGQQASLAQLKQGANVQVSYQPDANGKQIAKSINASSSAQPGAPSPVQPPAGTP